MAARAWMGNLEVGRNAALLGGTRREKEGITGNGESKQRPTIACLQDQKHVTTRRVCQQQRRRREILARFWQLLLGGNSATRWSLRFGDKHSRQLALCFFSALLISAARKHSNAGDSSFFLILFFCTSHASVLAFCFFLPHVQRREHQSKFGGVERRIASRQKRRLQTKSCFFILLLLLCFPDDYAIPCFRYLLLGHACPCKKIMLSCSFFRSLCTNHPSTTTASLSILSVCPTCKLVLAGKRGGGSVERSGKPKTCSRNSSARNEKQMTNIT